MTLGQYLKDLRLARGLSLREVANRSLSLRLTPGGGISRSQLLHIEQGKTKAPSLSKLATLARIYDADLSQFTSFFDQPGRLADGKHKETRALKTGLRESFGSRIQRVVKLLGSTKKRAAAIRTLVDAFRLTYLLEDVEDILDPATSGHIRVGRFDSEIPLPLRRIQRLIFSPFPEDPDAQTRRAVLNAVLDLHGPELDVAAEAFLLSYIRTPKFRGSVYRLRNRRLVRDYQSVLEEARVDSTGSKVEAIQQGAPPSERTGRHIGKTKARR